MISRGTYQMVPNASGSGSRRARAIKCPVCSNLLCADDLRPDPVLARRVRRAEEQLLRDAEEESDSERRRDGIALYSDAVDEMDVDSAESGSETRIKPEPVQASGESEGSAESEDSEDAEDAEDE